MRFYFGLIFCIAVLSGRKGLAAEGPTCSNLQAGGLQDSRFDTGLARWYIPDDLAALWIQDHEHPPLSFSEAYGQYVEGPDGLQFWDSHWIRFFYQWVYQMKRSPLRVHSPEAADFIFVPVCLGGWCARPTNPLYFRSPAYMWTHSHIDRKTFFFKHAPEMLPWLGKKPHVLVYNGALPGDLLRSSASNFTFIGLEAGLDMDPARFVTAPYPSHEHHDVNEPMPAVDSLTSQKEKLAVGIYVVRKAISDGMANTRTILHSSCTANQDDCTHITWDMHHNMSYKAEAYSNYTNHWFCLQPPGDWVLRGAFYDCLVAGGLPMVFNPDYAKFVAFSEVVDYSDLISQAPTAAELESADMDYIGHLRRFHLKGSSASTLRKLHDLGRIFEYAINPDHLRVRWADRNTRHVRDDAFTFSLKALLRALCRQPAFTNSKCQ